MLIVNNMDFLLSVSPQQSSVPPAPSTSLGTFVECLLGKLPAVSVDGMHKISVFQCFVVNAFTGFYVLY